MSRFLRNWRCVFDDPFLCWIFLFPVGQNILPATDSITVRKNEALNWDLNCFSKICQGASNKPSHRRRCADTLAPQNRGAGEKGFRSYFIRKSDYFFISQCCIIFILVNRKYHFPPYIFVPIGCSFQLCCWVKISLRFLLPFYSPLTSPYSSPDPYPSMTISLFALPLLFHIPQNRVPAPLNLQFFECKILLSDVFLQCQPFQIIFSHRAKFGVRASKLDVVFSSFTTVPFEYFLTFSSPCPPEIRFISQFVSLLCFCRKNMLGMCSKVVPVVRGFRDWKHFLIIIN